MKTNGVMIDSKAVCLKNDTYVELVESTFKEIWGVYLNN